MVEVWTQLMVLTQDMSVSKRPGCCRPKYKLCFTSHLMTAWWNYKHTLQAEPRFLVRFCKPERRKDYKNWYGLEIFYSGLVLLGLLKKVLRLHSTKRTK